MARKAAPPRQPDVAQVLARMKAGRARGRGQHSSLYRWFRANHIQLVEAFEADTPSWASLAAALGESGITDGDNKTPTAQGARTTWYRVRRDIAAARQAQGAKPAPAASGSEPTSPMTSSEPAESGGKVREEASPRRFRPVKLRGWESEGEQASQPAAKPATPIPSNPEPGVDADAVLSRFMPGATKRD